MKCKLNRGLHTLFMGANGVPTYGVLVERLEPRDEVEKRGYSRVFPVNDWSIIVDKELHRMEIPNANDIVHQCFELMKSRLT